MNLPGVTLVLGGARSGKSALGESLAAASGLPVTFIATGRASDPEMAARITRHRARRPAEWHLIESPLEPGAALESLPPGSVALLDDLALWLAARMEAGRKAPAEDLFRGTGKLILVSTEAGLGLVPDTALGRAWRDALGELNQAVAVRADLVLLAVAGLPLVLKGRMP